MNDKVFIVTETVNKAVVPQAGAFRSQHQAERWIESLPERKWTEIPTPPLEVTMLDFRDPAAGPRCTNCLYPVGKVVIPGQGSSEPLPQDKAIMICVKCMELMMCEGGRLRALSPQERHYFASKRTVEFLNLLLASYVGRELDRNGSN
jgi:hypothetical protein